ncbi:MAG: IS66 family transposase zinc-finger binding domain-containing protein [Thaumarchaeota archaeon]|nr:IS66 family transposase zinc-finger binding domain-containing protein [Nitrososphaerota archaeon]
MARSIDAKASLDRKRYKKSGRRDGHQGASRSRPEHVDETIELDQSTCPRCGGVLSENHTDSYTRIVEDIVPARIVVTEYVMRRRYCCRCRRQVAPAIPNVINGGSNERFGLRLMLLPHRLAEAPRDVLREDRLSPEAALQPRPHGGSDVPLRDQRRRCLRPEI